MKLYIHYPNVMTDDEVKALQQMKEKQTKRIQSVETKEASNKPPVVAQPKPVAQPTTKVKKKAELMRNPIDMYGKTINAGQYINYPVRKGSNIYMRTAKVIRCRVRDNHLDKPEIVLDVAVAIAPRAWERTNNKNWEQDVRVRHVTVSCPHRATILPEDYIKSDKRYRTLTQI